MNWKSRLTNTIPTGRKGEVVQLREDTDKSDWGIDYQVKYGKIYTVTKEVINDLLGEIKTPGDNYWSVGLPFLQKHFKVVKG